MISRSIPCPVDLADTSFLWQAGRRLGAGACFVGLLALLLLAMDAPQAARAVDAGDRHVFTGSGGATLEAEVLDFRDGMVVIRRLSDGQVFELAANRLAPQDVDFMRAWLAARESMAHPAGWKRIRVQVPEFADQVEAPGIPAAFRRVDRHLWEAELPEGAWVLVKLWREGGRDFAPQFLLPYQGEREWRLHYEDSRLYRWIDGGAEQLLAGITVGAEDGETELRAMKSEIPPGGVALYSGFLDARDFAALRGAAILSLVVTKLPDFSVARDGKARAVRVTEAMGEMTGLSGYDELEHLEAPHSGSYPMAECARLKRLRTLVTDGQVALGSVTREDSFPALRHLSLAGSDIEDGERLEAFLSLVPKLQSLALPDFHELELAGLAKCQDLTALELGDECLDPRAEGLGALPSLSIALLNASYGADEIADLAEQGRFDRVRVIRSAHPIDPDRVPALRRLVWHGGEDSPPLAGFAPLTSLPELELRGASDADLAALGEIAPNLAGLRSLALRFPVAEDLAPLSALPALEFLAVSDQLVTFDEKLTALNLSGFNALRGLELERLQNLQEIDFGGEAGTVSLEALVVRSCDDLAAVRAAEAPGLEELVVANARRLRALGGLLQGEGPKVRRFSGTPAGGSE